MENGGWKTPNIQHSTPNSIIHRAVIESGDRGPLSICLLEAKDLCTLPWHVRCSIGWRMEKTQKPSPWFSGGLAALVALFIVGLAHLNTGRAVIDHTVNRPRIHIQSDPSADCFVLVMAFAPVLCIFFLGRRWIVFDWLGWFVLAVLFFWAL